MSKRGQPIVVVVVKPSARLTGIVRDAASYTSKPGDARRSGRAQVAAGLAPIVVDWAERSNQIEARLGVVTVGAVTHDTTSKGYFWAVYLPGLAQTPRPARDSDAAKRAILHKVKEWCEAAKLITARRT